MCVNKQGLQIELLYMDCDLENDLLTQVRINMNLKRKIPLSPSSPVMYIVQLYIV